MAKVKGGITGRPAGKVASLIFGAARSREGKVVTVRELVAPSNPRTPEQQAQRNKFTNALNYTQGVGPDIYQSDWNRSVGQLPGFQSWMSFLTNNITESLVLEPPSDRQLGNLHHPDTWSASIAVDGTAIDVTWSDETGPNGTTSDEAVIIVLKADQGKESGGPAVVNTTATRPNGAMEVPTDWDARAAGAIVCLYFRGQSAAAGMLSLASWKFATL